MQREIINRVLFQALYTSALFKPGWAVAAIFFQYINNKQIFIQRTRPIDIYRLHLLYDLKSVYRQLLGTFDVQWHIMEKWYISYTYYTVEIFNE